MGMYTTDSRMEEKTEMIELNDKLAKYMQRVRQLGPGGTEFLDILRSMDNDVRKLKAMYESELEKHRQKLEEANKLKNQALSENEKHKRAACDFEDRFRAENDKNRKLMTEISCIKQRMADLERELANAKTAAETPQTMLASMQKDLEREKTRNKEITKELDEERTKSKQLEDKIRNLQQKVDFNGQLSNEQIRDTNNRLEQAKKVIKDLEAKNRDLEQQNAGLPGMLDKMRKKTDQELAKYKADMENDTRKNNEVIKKQLEDQSRTIDQLKADNAKLEKENERLMETFRAMEAQIKDLSSKKATLEDQLRLERSKSQEQLRKLERQLKELQELLMERTQEVNTGRDAQMSLKTEIENYRLLLDEEERRLRSKECGSPVGSRGNLSSAASGRYSNSRGRSASPDKAQGGNKFGTQKQGQSGKNDPQTEYQFAYNRYGGKRYHFGDSGLYKRSKANGLPTLMPATGGGRGCSSNMRKSMPN